MKKLLLLALILSVVLPAFSQQRTVVPKEKRDVKVRKVSRQHQEVIAINPITLPATKKALIPDEEDIGESFYDLQSNNSNQNRFHVYPDGTMAGVWTFGMEAPGFSNRGTGYNYFDGDSWGDIPTERIESIRTGWPSYAPYGENGEIVVSHDFSAGTLYYLWRDQKGAGNWSEEEFAGPDGHEISWNRSTTSGINNSVVHTIAITWPIVSGGTTYEGLDGALLYSRTSDGGTTWDMENVVLDELSSDYFYGFGGDIYDIISEGDNVAILVGDSWRDLVLLKSSDGGDEWTRTVIWEHPYPKFDLENLTVTNGFYCPDGAHHLAYDNDGKIHVVFGINRASADEAGTYWFPAVGGIAYWNEDRPTFSADTLSLCPYSDCEYSELVDDYSLIGWAQDLNGNDTIDTEDPLDLAAYYLGFSSMPQITIDDQNRIFVVYSSITEGYTGGLTNQTYRHLWSRDSPNGDWWGQFTDLTASLEHVFDECVFPSIASYSDDYIYLMYQRDEEPGLHVRGDEDPPTHNDLTYMAVLKETVGVEENNIPVFDYDVSQNYPNPFNGTSTVKVNVRQATELSLEVVNMIGQVVYTYDAGVAQPGLSTINIDGTKLTSGIYFYTVRAGETEITKKMIVE